MLSGLYKIGSRLMFEAQRQEHIAQNLAGTGVSGFKGVHLSARTFQRQLDEQGQTTYGVDIAEPMVDFAQGGLNRTGRALDFSLSGPGFFQVQNADGTTFLTRNGGFSLSPTGTLVTSEGHTVLGKGGPIRLDLTDDATKLEVTEQGEILVPAKGDGGMRSVGTLDLGTVEQPDSLVRISASYFLPAPEQTVSPAPGARVANGYQEQSNTSPVREMAAMIQSLREFESAQRMIKILTELSQDENQKLA